MIIFSFLFLIPDNKKQAASTVRNSYFVCPQSVLDLLYCLCASAPIRTESLLFTRQLRYQLRHKGIVRKERIERSALTDISRIPSPLGYFRIFG